MAVREWNPSVEKEVVHVVEPLLSTCEPQPVIVLVPSMNATAPVGVPDPLVTVAVSVVELFVPEVKEGFSDEVRLVDVPVSDAVVIISDQLLMDTTSRKSSTTYRS